MKLGTPSSRPLLRMNIVRRRHLADLRVLEEGRDHELALGEVVDRAEVDVLLVLVRERRQDGEAEHRQRDDAADHGAEAERRGARNVLRG